VLSGVLLAVVIGVGLGLLIGALLFTILLLKNKYVVVPPCYRRWCNNLNEPLDPFPFLVAAE